MPKLRPEKPTEVIRKLRRLGFEGPFGGGRHPVMATRGQARRSRFPCTKAEIFPEGRCARFCGRRMSKSRSGSISNTAISEKEVVVVYRELSEEQGFVITAFMTSRGCRLANGVYFYVLAVKGTYGDVVTTKVQKFALLR